MLNFAYKKCLDTCYQLELQNINAYRIKPIIYIFELHGVLPT